MHPALPDQPFEADAGDVGAFEQGSPLSRWALARYLVGRAIGESVGRTLLLVAMCLLGVAAACQWALHATFLAIVVAVLALTVLLLRTALRAILRRLTTGARPVDARLRELVAATRGDVLRELRRIGLPSHTATLPLLAFRLIGRRRAPTLARIRQFDLDRAVPRARLDELHMLLRDGTPGRAG